MGLSLLDGIFQSWRYCFNCKWEKNLIFSYDSEKYIFLENSEAFIFSKLIACGFVSHTDVLQDDIEELQ